jgi:hypothetical protein
VRPARRADSSAVLVVPNVKLRMGAQHYIPPPPSLHDLLHESFALLLTAMYKTYATGYCRNPLYNQLHIEWRLTYKPKSGRQEKLNSNFTIGIKQFF